MTPAGQMSATDEGKTAGGIRRTPRGKRPQHFQDPATDKLLSMVMTLAEELSVTRDRLDTLEQLLAEHRLLPSDAVEAFEPGEDMERRREQRRGAFVERLLQSLQAEVDAALDARARE